MIPIPGNEWDGTMPAVLRDNDAGATAPVPPKKTRKEKVLDNEYGNV
jgi:hypothetical protein